MNINLQLAQEFNLKQNYADNIVSLIEEGNTIPFIARYRKEMHGGCDDALLRDFNDRLTYLKNLEKRKEEVQSAIEGQGKWTDERAAALDKAATLTEVEDVYRPYKQKKKTRASVAIEKGLQPLSDIIMQQQDQRPIEEIAAQFIDAEKGVESASDAIAGAQDIVAETMSDDAELSKAGDASVVVVLEDMLLEGKESSVELRRILSSTMARCAMWSRAVQSRAELSALLTFLGLKQSSWEAKDIVKGVAQSDSTEMHR